MSSSAARHPTTAGPRAGRPGLEYVRGVVGSMYPGASVTVGRRPRHADARAWALVPRAADPRLLVPTRNRAVAGAVVSGLGGGGARGVAVSLLGRAARSGLLGLLPHLVVAPRPGAPALDILLEEVLGRPVTLAMGVGRVRALQKPVLRVLGDDGSTLAFAKVGVDATTRALVDHEAAVLGRLGRVEVHHLVVPTVLAHEGWEGLSVLVQSPVGGRGRVTPSLVSAAAVELAGLDDTVRSPVGAQGPWSDLVDRVRRLPASGPGQVLDRTLARMAAGADGTPVPWASWHGDFAPWNMAPADGRLAVWDWEGHGGPVPAGSDLLHHRLQELVVVCGVHPRAAVAELEREADGLLAPWSPADPALVLALYLVELALGYLETGDHQTRLSRLEEWLEPSLAGLTAGRWPGGR
ncbi:hypothetical protein [Phycicoccus jejuensis]|uniref:hypothetical protein n=1 Tax=Phycicoccus jejuensis TaxID=367299 RepID=UPI0004C3F541|nr:hypothetical protein [Phycicoccus jejuensis]